MTVKPLELSRGLRRDATLHEDGEVLVTRSLILPHQRGIPQEVDSAPQPVVKLWKASLHQVREHGTGEACHQGAHKEFPGEPARYGSVDDERHGTAGDGQTKESIDPQREEGQTDERSHQQRDTTHGQRSSRQAPQVAERSLDALGRSLPHGASTS